MVFDITQQQAADILGIAKGTLASWRSRGTHNLKSKKSAKGIWYNWAEVEALLERKGPFLNPAAGMKEKSEICCADGCNRKAFSKNMCGMHYQRMWSNGTFEKKNSRSRAVMTDSERRVLAFVISYMKNNLKAPTLKEISDRNGLSISGADYQLVKLAEKGLLSLKVGAHRGIELAGNGDGAMPAT